MTTSHGVLIHKILKNLPRSCPRPRPKSPAGTPPLSLQTPTQLKRTRHVCQRYPPLETLRVQEAWGRRGHRLPGMFTLRSGGDGRQTHATNPHAPCRCSADNCVRGRKTTGTHKSKCRQASKPPRSSNHPSSRQHFFTAPHAVKPAGGDLGLCTANVRGPPCANSPHACESVANRLGTPTPSTARTPTASAL